VKIFKQCYTTKRGFSIIEVMIAVSLLAALTVAFLHLTDNIKKMETRMLSTVDSLELISRIKLSLSSTKWCKEFLTSAREMANQDKMVDGVIDQNLPIPLKGSLHYLKDTNGNLLVELGTKYGRNRITKMEYNKSPNSFTDDTYILKPGIIDLFLTFERGSSLIPVVKKIPISILASKASERSNPQLVDCYSQNSQLVRDISKDVAIRVCLSFGATYNEFQEKCDLENSELMKNSKNSSSSPTNNNKKMDDNELKQITDSVMINVCRSLGSSYDSAASKCEMNMNSPEMEQMKDFKIDPEQMKELMQKMFQ
jgi:prepilin-type N-terminal cleavage/methylation domain-containing protein